MTDVLCPLISLILAFIVLRFLFKLGYYETRCDNNNIDHSSVKNMPWYKLWMD